MAAQARRSRRPLVRSDGRGWRRHRPPTLRSTARRLPLWHPLAARRKRVLHRSLRPTLPRCPWCLLLGMLDLNAARRAIGHLRHSNHSAPDLAGIAIHPGASGNDQNHPSKKSSEMDFSAFCGKVAFIGFSLTTWRGRPYACRRTAGADHRQRDRPAAFSAYLIRKNWNRHFRLFPEPRLRRWHLDSAPLRF